MSVHVRDAEGGQQKRGKRLVIYPVYLGCFFWFFFVFFVFYFSSSGLAHAYSFTLSSPSAVPLATVSLNYSTPSRARTIKNLKARKQRLSQVRTRVTLTYRYV